MSKISVSTKIPQEVIKRISQTGHSTSDVVQVSLEVFLSLPLDRQAALMKEHILRKKREKAMKLYLNKRSYRDKC